MQEWQDEQPGQKDKSEDHEGQSPHLEQHRQHSQDGQTVKTGVQDVKEQRIIAYFSSLTQAQRAAQKISSRALYVHINEISVQRMHEKLNSEQEGISIAEIGVPAWLGLSFGLIAGAILGMLIYSNKLALPGTAHALSAGPVAVSFLWAGVLGSIGWLVGALVHLLRTSKRKTIPELRAVVPKDARSEIEKTLLDIGAWNVLAASGAEHAHSETGESALHKHES